MAKYINYYCCDNCAMTWNRQADSPRNDKCPRCRSHPSTEPYKSEDVTPSIERPIEQLVKELVEKVSLEATQLDGDDLQPIIEGLVVGLRNSTEGTECECNMIAESLLRAMGYEI